MPDTCAAYLAWTTERAWAVQQDQIDPLTAVRNEFHIPQHQQSDCEHSMVYLCGNSLGLEPKSVAGAITRELEDWARLGVRAHTAGRNPWYRYHEQLREPLAKIVGASCDEVVAMNSLTVNLHLLMTSFYRPTAERPCIIIEDSAFPSDSYATASQIRYHGFDPEQHLIRLKPRDGEQTLCTGDIIQTIQREGSRTALVMLGGVNYLTGQWFDMPAITQTGHEQGCVVGWDLAHAAGNVPMQLHDWGVDFAAWCSYKYLNSGPGAIAGAFIHEKHLKDAGLPRFAGWWGTDPVARFKMDKEFVPVCSADAWQLSNPPILSMTPVIEALAIHDRVGMAALRERSIQLTGYAAFLLSKPRLSRARIITPEDVNARGAQLSLFIEGGSLQIHNALLARSVTIDFREPNIIRAAPAPLYNSFEDVWRFVDALAEVLEA